jgi:hypothetical protein
VMSSRYRKSWLTLSVLVLLHSARGEEKPGIPFPEECQSNATGPKTAQSLTAHSANTKLGRWFELQNATLSSRYKYVETSGGVTTSNHLQHKESLKARFKFDAKGQFSFNAGMSSGRNFIAGWNNTGLGTGDAQSNLALKQLYFSAASPKGVYLDLGGLYVARGRSTEITSYDDDGYIVGERLGLTQPGRLFFDEILITYAYIGDVNTPNLTKRFHRIKQSNYHQFLVVKKLGKHATVSANYTFEAGRETLRQALELNLRHYKALDLIRFENYQRLDVHPDYGFAAYGERTLVKNLTAGLGYAQIDPRYGGLNGDRFLNGKRLYLMTTFVLSPEFTMSAYLTRAVANTVPVSQGTRFDLVFNYNLLRTLKRL